MEATSIALEGLMKDRYDDHRCGTASVRRLCQLLQGLDVGVMGRLGRVFERFAGLVEHDEQSRPRSRGLDDTGSSLLEQAHELLRGKGATMFCAFCCGFDSFDDSWLLSWARPEGSHRLVKRG